MPAGATFSVALVDVHRFRDINASVGHVVGDQLLQALAARLAKLCGDSTLCARIGADQFVVTAPLHDSELLHRLLMAADEWRAGVTLGELRLSVDIRAGISEWRAPRVSVEDLLRQADVALLQAKEQSTVAVVYQPAHDADHRRRIMLVAELRRALAGDGLALHYQPLVEHDGSHRAELRGAAALESSDAGQHFAGRIHPAGRARVGVAGPVALGAGCRDRAAGRVAARGA